MKKIAISVALLALSFCPAGLLAQNAQDSGAAEPPQHFYRLNLVVEQLNEAGKVTNTRAYEETVITTVGKIYVPDQQIKTGSRVPILTGSYGPNSSPANTQFQYIDLGVNIDVRDAREHGDMLSFRLKAEVSSIASQTQIAGVGEPVIRQNSWDSTVLVPVGKPTVVYSSDDLDDRGKIAIQVTATRLD